MDAILRVASGDPVTAIAVATHGRSGISRMLNGSVAARYLIKEISMRMNRLTLVAALLVAMVAGHAPTDDKKADPPPPKRLDPMSPQGKLMAEKLKQAQLLLDGLATNDFAKISKSADELLIISKSAEFHARKTRQYELHTLSFRRALEEIVQKSKEKNLDGATLGYVDMTLTCVRCHKYTREEGDALLPLPVHRAE